MPLTTVPAYTEMLQMLALFALPFLSAWVLATSDQQPFLQLPLSDVTLVPVTLGVMSRCPDAALCENTFDDVLERVGSKVDIGLSFIAKLNESEPTYGVTCMHGQSECAGNIHELCVIKHNHDAKLWWPFVRCLNFNGREAIGQEAVARSCAKVVGIDWDASGVGACVDGLEGSELLRESVQNSTKLGIEKSCTIMINNVVRCIVDGGRWSSCDDGHAPRDFVRRINNEYSKLNP